MSHDANHLRKIAERADGTRGKDQYLVVRGEEVELVDEKPDGSNEKFATIHTKYSGDGMRKSPQLKADGKATPEKADALFASQSAVEKFLVPYYARTRTPKELQNLVDELFKAGRTVAFHMPGSDVGGALVESIPGLYAMDENGKITLIAED